MVKHDSRRKERIRKLMAYSYELCRAYGEVWLSDDGQACALLLFPDKKRNTWRTLLWDAQLALQVIGIGHVGAVLKREAMIKANHPKMPIAYLWFIGVLPQVQGKGIGTALLQEVINACEELQRPIYLETSMQQNLPFYTKMDFEIFHSLELGYTIYQLRRLKPR